MSGVGKVGGEDYDDRGLVEMDVDVDILGDIHDIH